MHQSIESERGQLGMDQKHGALQYKYVTEKERTRNSTVKKQIMESKIAGSTGHRALGEHTFDEPFFLVSITVALDLFLCAFA